MNSLSSILLQGSLGGGTCAELVDGYRFIGCIYFIYCDSSGLNYYCYISSMKAIPCPWL